MRGIFKAGLIAVLLTALAGCQLLNNKWIRIHRADPEATLIKLKSPNFRGPRERVERLFQAYARKDWEDIEDMLSKYSDMHFMKDKISADFGAYEELIPEIKASDPIFNKAEDRARVKIRFDIEKIEKRTGKLVKTRGSGTFVLSDVGGWDVIGYVGDAFWGPVP